VRRASLLLVLLLAAGCGGESGDLIAFEDGTNEIVLADNGLASCNGGAEEAIDNQLLIDAREVEREIGDLAEESARYPATQPGRKEYVVRTKDGTVRFGEGETGLPEVLPKAQLLAVRLRRQLC
jgi:hypothetical protein